MTPEQHERAQRLKAVQLLGRVYVGGIPFDAGEQEIAEAFRPFGAIQQCAFTYDQALNKHKGFCFVEYDAPEAALLALEQMTSYNIKGRTLKIGRPNNAPQALPYLETLAAKAAEAHRIYVSSIHPDLGELEIKSVFESFGPVTRVILAPGAEGKGNHRGYGWVDFEEQKSVPDAIKSMNLFDLGGQFLRVSIGIRFDTRPRMSPSRPLAFLYGVWDTSSSCAACFIFFTLV
ncbi:uncharacterized protein MONBRDRAFT_17439 [Monosiga brevicollis MX1]|uniref:RRM domain-containing protein n=1 Tax=Monosiga brevicollis TaxID=81824 RepID=A9URN5_MONBE|nr:uncharacterized protein MONBRDRAFT_17439 [Monosiga brevicollis MX1]EDQ91638.1 predicted protein [Monosiga brevicollis MX1]|eukprot:XP_001742924.1 hypothetical protein [Monosiga brevicollis MX1]